MMASYLPPTARQKAIIDEIMQLAHDFNHGKILFAPYCDAVAALWREYDSEHAARKSA